MNRHSPNLSACRPIVLALGITVLAIAPLSRIHGQGSAPPKEAPASKQPGGTAPAAQTPSTPNTKPPTLTLPAMLIADESADIYAKASGFVGSVVVDIGSKVKKGDVLAQLDIPEMADELRHGEATLASKKARVDALKAKVAQAQLMIESARADHQRATAERELSRITHQRKAELHTEKAIPDQELDEAKSRMAISEAEVLIAQAKVAAAEGNLRVAEADVAAAESEETVAQADVARLKTLINYTTITAPFDGTVSARNVDTGAFVRSAAQSAGAPLFTLKTTHRLRVVIDVPEEQAALVHPGTPLDVQVQTLLGSALKLTVSRTANAIRSDTRTMRAEADLDNSEGRFIPGMYAKVVIHLQPEPAAQSGT